MKHLLVAIVVGIGLGTWLVQAESAQEKYDVVHVTGEQTAPIDCPPVFEGTLEPVGIADCNVADGTLVVRNAKRGPTKFSVDTTASWPEYQ